MHPVRPFIALASFLALSLSAQTTNPPAVQISLQECVRLAVQQNLRLQIARRGPVIAGYEIREAYGVQYDPVFSFEAKRQHDDVPATFDPKKSGVDLPYQETFDIFSAGISGHATPGLSYNLNGNSIKDSAISDFRLVGNSVLRHTNNWDALIQLELRQSLLRNFWIDSERVHIQIARKDLKISEQSVRLQLMNTVLAVQNAYYDLIYAEESVKVRTKALEFANELLADDRQKIAAGAMLPSDEKLAESQVETAKANLIAAEELLETGRNNLRSLITDRYASAPRETLAPSDKLVVVPDHPDRAECLRSAMTMRPEVLQSKLEAEKQGIVLRYNYNQMFPILDLVGSLGTVGTEASSRGATFGTLADADHPIYSAGVVLKIPLSNMAARNRYRAGKEVKEQALLKVKTIEQDIFVQTDNVLASIDKSYQRVSATRKAREYAQIALDAERKKLENNASTSFLVIEYERNLVMARNDEILAMVDYNKAQAHLAYSKGEILENHQVKLDVQ